MWLRIIHRTIWDCFQASLLSTSGSSSVKWGKGYVPVGKVSGGSHCDCVSSDAWWVSRYLFPACAQAPHPTRVPSCSVALSRKHFGCTPEHKPHSRIPRWGQKMASYLCFAIPTPPAASPLPLLVGLREGRCGRKEDGRHLVQVSSVAQKQESRNRLAAGLSSRCFSLWPHAATRAPVPEACAVTPHLSFIARSASGNNK